MKKKWSKPKLIILTRGKPEERVLTGCKGLLIAGPEVDHIACINSLPPDCDACNTGGSS